jgi:fused signal recognition particle receptor
MNFAEKMMSLFSRRGGLSPEFFEELAELLVEGDFDAKEAFAVSENLEQRCGREKVSDADAAREMLAGILEETLRKALPPGGTEELLALPDDRLTVVLMLGVNGVGKTTTAAKLAAMHRERKPVLAAADTFRAAAIDQLKIHGERLGLRVVAHKPGGDPAAVVYDAVEAAQSGGIKNGMVIADTAGRMHTKSALVEELRKIDRIVEAKAAGCRYVKYLVLDSTTGRNATAQAEVFCEAVSPEAAILTKYDSTAKGGSAFSLASSLRLPVAYLCHGEGYGDIRAFDPLPFAKEFAGAGRKDL